MPDEVRAAIPRNERGKNRACATSAAYSATRDQAAARNPIARTTGRETFRVSLSTGRSNISSAAAAHPTPEAP